MLVVSTQHSHQIKTAGEKRSKDAIRLRDLFFFLLKAWSRRVQIYTKPWVYFVSSSSVFSKWNIFFGWVMRCQSLFIWSVWHRLALVAYSVLLTVSSTLHSASHPLIYCCDSFKNSRHCHIALTSGCGEGQPIITGWFKRVSPHRRTSLQVSCCQKTVQYINICTGHNKTLSKDKKIHSVPSGLDNTVNLVNMIC